MPKNLRGKAAVKDSIMIVHIELFTLVMCINMSIYIINALKANVPSEKVDIFTDSLLNLQRIQRELGDVSHGRRNGSFSFLRTGEKVQSLSARGR